MWWLLVPVTLSWPLVNYVQYYVAGHRDETVDFESVGTQRKTHPCINKEE
jgi:hypothetical protein